MISRHKISEERLWYYLAYCSRVGEPGHWLGTGAGVLGVDGTQISRDALFHGFLGIRPQGDEALALPHQSRRSRMPGWDFTFSAPKSVSLLALGMARREDRDQVTSAHSDAVADAVGFLEAQAARCRVTSTGDMRHVEAKVLAAAFLHHTSREDDPQIHTHVLISNRAQCPDGLWRALDGRLLYRHFMAASAVYQASLRRRLALSGAVWAPVAHKGLFELAGFDQGTLRAFSKRRAAIEEALVSMAGAADMTAEEAGRAPSPAAQAQTATLSTRPGKDYLPLDEVRQTTRARLAEAGYDERALAAILNGEGPGSGGGGGTGGPGPTNPDSGIGGLSLEEVEAAIAHLVGPGGLTASKAAFRRDDVVRAWAGLLPQGARPDVLGVLADDTIARCVPLVVATNDGQVLRRGRKLSAEILRLVRADTKDPKFRLGSSEIRYTTHELLAVESGAIRQVAESRSARRARVGSRVLNEVVGRSGLFEDQELVVRTICTSGRGIEAVVGPPGTGKSYTLRAAAAAWRASGVSVTGLAHAGLVADDLAASARIPAHTIDSWLHGLTTGRTSVKKGQVILLDEANMVDSRRLAKVIEVATEHRAKLVLIGDPRQLPSIEAGGLFAGIVRRFSSSSLSVNRRQVTGFEVEAIEALRTGRTADAVARYSAMGRIRVGARPQDVMANLVADWYTTFQTGAEVAIFAHLRDDVAALNRLVRSVLVEAGHVQAGGVEVPATRLIGQRTFAVGDSILCLRTDRRLGVRNGTRGQIVATDPDGSVVVATRDGMSLHLHAKYVRGSLDYGWAMTVHKSEGRTVGETSVRADGGRQRGYAFVYGADGLDRSLALVAVSRAVDGTALYVCAPEASTETSEPVEQTLGQRWESDGTGRAASDEIAFEHRAIKLAAGTSLRTLYEARDHLRALVGPGGAVDLDAALIASTARVEGAETTRRVARSVLANLEAQLDSPEPVTRTLLVHRIDEQAGRVGLLDEALRSAEWCRDLVRGLVEQVTAATTAGQRDLLRLGDELDVVDRAINLRRRMDTEARMADPPGYVTDVVGPRPTTYAEAIAWYQGVQVVEDFVDPERLAVGTPADWRAISIARRMAGGGGDTNAQRIVRQASAATLGPRGRRSVDDTVDRLLPLVARYGPEHTARVLRHIAPQTAAATALDLSRRARAEGRVPVGTVTEILADELSALAGVEWSRPDSPAEDPGTYTAGSDYGAIAPPWEPDAGMWDDYGDSGPVAPQVGYGEEAEAAWELQASPETDTAPPSGPRPDSGPRLAGP